MWNVIDVIYSEIFRKTSKSRVVGLPVGRQPSVDFPKSSSRTVPRRLKRPTRRKKERERAGERDSA